MGTCREWHCVCDGIWVRAAG
eukprot:COSAG02_NODE_37878_length_436_cov_0.902077_2_plen_20_part_01